MNSNQATFTLMAALCSFGFGHSPPPPSLTIEMENVGRYNENFETPQRNGTSTTMEAQAATLATTEPGPHDSSQVGLTGGKLR